MKVDTCPCSEYLQCGVHYGVVFHSMIETLTIQSQRFKVLLVNKTGYQFVFICSIVLHFPPMLQLSNTRDTFPHSGWVTLGSVESEFSGYKNERGFHGRIARLNAWNRPLDFRAEIPKMVREKKIYT